MSKEIKSGIGYIIPAGALAGYVIASFSGLYLISIVFAVIGILGWFLYALVMDLKLPDTMGNMVIVFALLIGIGIFMSYGIEQDIFGGYMFKVDGTIFSLLVVLFGVMGGILFNRSRNEIPTDLSAEDKELVKAALQTSDEGGPDPKIIVVKQESAASNEDEDEDDSYPGYYPPEDYYYDDDDEEYEDEDEWEEEDEED